jgi:hypothetical protein
VVGYLTVLRLNLEICGGHIPKRRDLGKRRDLVFEMVDPPRYVE